MPVIDVHTHMLSHKWLELLKTHAKRYTVEKSKDGPNAIFQSGAQFMTLQEGMFDYDLRIKNMNDAKVDIAVVTLTCPNVYWGGPEISLQAAKVMNDDIAAAQRTYPDRIRWMCSLPWEHADLAVAELARACDNGAVGVMVLANINGRSSTEGAFAPVWKEIDRRALPVLVHPSTPPGADQMDAATYQLIGSAGFLFDTTLAFNRMILGRVFRPVSERQTDRLPWRRIPAVPRRAHGHLLRPHAVDPWEDLGAAKRILAPNSTTMRRFIVAMRLCFVSMSPEATA